MRAGIMAGIATGIARMIGLSSAIVTTTKTWTQRLKQMAPRGAIFFDLKRDDVRSNRPIRRFGTPLPEGERSICAANRVRGSVPMTDLSPSPRPSPKGEGARCRCRYRSSQSHHTPIPRRGKSGPDKSLVFRQRRDRLPVRIVERQVQRAEIGRLALAA